jgi:hypothetical protein
MMRLALTLVCFALVVAVNGDALPSDVQPSSPEFESQSPEFESLFPGIEPSEEISSEELRKELSALEIEVATDDEMRNFAALLFAVKDKDSTKIFRSLTVANLTEQANMNVAGCSRDALKKRQELFEIAGPGRRGYQRFWLSATHFHVALYVMDTIERAAKYCLAHKNEVIAEGINDEEFMEEMKRAVFWDSTADENSMLPSHLLMSGQSNLIKLIRLGRNVMVTRNKERMLPSDLREDYGTAGSR